MDDCPYCGLVGKYGVCSPLNPIYMVHDLSLIHIQMCIRDSNEPIPWTDLVDEFTGFKNFEGEFVQRRIAAFKRKCLKEGITHSDDISIAAIHV